MHTVLMAAQHKFWITNTKTGRISARFCVLFSVLISALFIETTIAQSLSAGEAPPQDQLETPKAQSGSNFSQDLERVRILVRANVLGLAEEILVNQGPPLVANKIWRAWQRQLWKIYSVQGKWQALYNSAASVPNDFPLGMRKEAHLQAVDALIAQAKGKLARTSLRAWLLSGEFDERHKLALRQRLVESYLVDDLPREAQVAMQQFQRDYRSQDPEWLMLSARIHLQVNRSDEAVNLLSTLVEPEAKLLQLYARLLNESLTPIQVVDKVLAFQTKYDARHLAKPALAVLIAAYDRANKLYPRVDALEAYLSIQFPGIASLEQAFPDFDHNDLPLAYRRVALDQGNRFGLLVGQDAEWLSHANSKADSATITRRSLFAYIAENAEYPEARQLARNAYVNLLVDIDRTDLIGQLFGDEKPLGKLLLSGATGLRLSNFALEKGDIQLAADANENLLQLPPGMDRYDWLLHSARLAIIAGRYKQGSTHLSEWIESHQVFEPDQTDQVLQPVFDLQTVEQHRLALPLLLAINKRSPSDRHKREIAYWIAESYFGTRDFLRAADYFLFSAMQKEDGFDQWGESARFKAAEALVEADMVKDAKTLFEDLLARAQEENRKIALKQKLQQLWLKESNLQSEESVSSQIN